MRGDAILDCPAPSEPRRNEWDPGFAKVTTFRRKISEWNPEKFAAEQIRGLVRQVFTAKVTPPVRQIVFSAVEPHVDVGTLSVSVGECLARETSANVAVLLNVSRSFSAVDGSSARPDDADQQASLRNNATHRSSNLWLLNDVDGERVSATSLQAYLARIRTEFWYSILEGPPVGRSDDATAMAQFADGMILVLSAQYTRRATALKVKRALESANVRLLGSVLSDREFPMPEGIYRRL